MDYKTLEFSENDSQSEMNSLSASKKAGREHIWYVEVKMNLRSTCLFVFALFVLLPHLFLSPETIWEKWGATIEYMAVVSDMGTTASLSFFLGEFS